jgi:glycosyltransferase 2 family protein
MSRGRLLRLVATIVVTALGVGYLAWKIDVHESARLLVRAHPGWFVAAVTVMALSVFPMAWRWQRLLRAKGIEDNLPWLARAYFVSYTAGQFLPTAVGGDAVRILETARRHPGRGGPIAGSILLERALGAAATLVLAAVGFALALGRYDVGAYLWIQAFFVAATVVVGITFFSRAARRPLRLLVPLLRAVRLERPLRAAYEGIHAYRENVALLLAIFALTVAIQAVRILAIWFSALAVGVDLEARVYYVMGPLLFLVMLVPFTVNGLAVREAFFVSFLGTLGVGADPAFATGFLFFLVVVALSVPGALLLAWQGLRGGARPRPAQHG